ncbi:MAG: DUF2807 domain-containing protein [Polyangiaceae bacterium]|nr:DUF2807 domain-containing protein [Polyangiaceae bacterium]
MKTTPSPLSTPCTSTALRSLRRLAVAAGALAAALSSGCFVSVQGSGVAGAQPRQVPAFRAIALHGPIDASVTVGREASVLVRCDDNLLPLLRTAVRGEELVIDVDERAAGGGLAPLAPCAVDVTAPAIASVAVNGSGELRVLGSAVDLARVSVTGSGEADIAEIRSDVVELDVTGSGGVRVGRLWARSVTLSTTGSGTAHIGGQAASLRVESSGSGDVEAGALAAERADVEVSGSASVRVRASRTASVLASGSGDVRVAGGPAERSAHASGGADIVFE